LIGVPGEFTLCSGGDAGLLFLSHWDDEIIDHLAQHGVAQDEFAEVVENPDERGMSRSTGRPTATGVTSSGKTLYTLQRVASALGKRLVVSLMEK